MTDYSSWKVADLKTELKKRGIPQTGLRLKQQIIDKLVEEEQANPEGSVTPTNEPEPQPEPIVQTEAQPAPAEEAPAPAQEPEPQPSPAKEETAQYEEEPSQSSGTLLEDEKTKEDEPVKQQQVVEAPSKEEPAPTEDVEMAPAPAAPEEDAKAQPAEQATAPVEQAPAEQATAPVEQAPAEQATAPVEQAPAEQATVDSNELADETKASVPSAIATSEANTELSTPLPIEEALEDKRKRKRRSQSPVPTPEAIAAKKARAEDGSPRAPLQDDEEPSTETKDNEESTKEEQSIPTGPKMQREPSAARFKGLFASNGPAPTQPQQPAADVTMEDAVVEPALHPATSALYIDGLMRPLQPNALRSHLVTLAAAPDSDPNPEIIQDFFLDAIKTHCFASFTDVNAASRVRAALHGTTWPNERNRKALRADFIPEDKVKEWIQTEESSRDRSGPPTRWEVRYESHEDEGMQAILAESGPSSRAQPPSRSREAGFNRTPPLGPRGSVAQADRRPSNAPPAPPSRPGQGFKPLDDLFESTTTKPKLYYQRVPRKVADKRLDQFDDLLQKGTFPRAGGDEMRRITFEDEDYFVDIGPEYGPNALARRGGRGGRGGGRRHGGRR